jgi:hypothetical protein
MRIQMTDTLQMAKIAKRRKAMMTGKTLTKKRKMMIEVGMRLICCQYSRLKTQE